MVDDFSGIRFEASDIIAEGGQRIVYAHPNYPHLVFKRQKPLAELDLKNDLKGWLIRRFPDLANYVVKQEYRAYVNACLSVAHDFDTLPISKMFGFTQSNIGIVQISEKVSRDGKTIGPTLAQLHSGGELTADRISLLTDFVRLFAKFEIPTNDVSGSNIVLGKRGTAEQFICVDGFGDIHLIPVRTYIRRARRDGLALRMEKLARGLDLSFDKGTLTFAAA